MKCVLAGLRVLVTRAAEDAPELETMLRERGATPVRMPCIAFEDGPDTARIAAVVREKLADLVVLASPHAARRLLALCGAPGVPLAAVGAATARELPGEVIVPRTGAGAAALVKELGGRVAGKRVLVARAEGGNPALVEGLRGAGAEVEVRTLYRTVTAEGADPAILRELREGRIDAISFASGSAARGFAALAGSASAGRAAVACMGQQCAEEARNAGIRVDAVADGSLAELCDALALAVRAREV
jgi:uroporphyrinogen-III synthase